MLEFDTALLAASTGGRWASRPQRAPTGFCVDARRLKPGEMFVALKTSKRDGHEFIGQALRAGASAALVSRADKGEALAQLVVEEPLAALQKIAREHRRSFRGPVVAITGSAGKTSTKELLSTMLGAEEGSAVATEGNLNNHIGVALTLTRLDPTRHRFAVVEAGISAPGEMRVLASMIEPDVALVTLVAPAHLEELGGTEGVAREKAILVGAVRPGGIGVFPSSCEAFEAFTKMPRRKCVVLVPAGTEAKASPGRVPFAVSHSPTATTVTLFAPSGPDAFELRRVSDGMAQNAALALVVAHRLGIASGTMRERLSTWNPAPLRGEWRSSAGRRLYLDCYNANPSSMVDALAIFNDLAPRDEPRLFLLGCMEELGQESRRYHLELGRSLGLRAGDQLVVVGSLAEVVREGAVEGGASPEQITVSESVAPLAERLSAFRGTVFVKGSRRHELEKAFADPMCAESSHA
jgi:UDP-N-acetylmuramoyl-tripeptide--D-alanyl-D-alanine ligase